MHGLHQLASMHITTNFPLNWLKVIVLLAESCNEKSTGSSECALKLENEVKDNNDNRQTSILTEAITSWIE